MSGTNNGVGAAIILIGVIVGIAVYIFGAYCSYKISKKAGIKHAWMSWVPILSAWPYMWTIGKSAWWILMMFVPIANVVFAIMWHVRFLNCFGKSGHWLWFFLLPYVGPIIIFILHCYIALSSKVQYRGLPHMVYNNGVSL